MTDQHGAGLGRALSRILGDTIIHATATSADHLANAKSRSVETKMEEAEEILRPVVSALIKDLLGMDALPDNWRPFLEAAAGPSHQFDWVLQGAAMLGMVIGSLGALGKIDLQPLVNQYWSQYPTVPISPADLADMVERNIMPMSTATEMAAESGVNSVNFGFMVEDTGEPYGIEQALSLLRRGLISEGDFTRVLYYSRVRNEFLGQVLQLAHDTMSPGDAIEGALKGVLDAATARDLFEKGGGLGEQFDTLLNITGNPIGVQEANTLFNHGLITDAELTQVILHSRVNPIFEPMAKLLRHRFLAPFQVSQALKAGAATSAEATSWLLADGYPADQVAAVVAEGFGVKVAKHKDLTEAQITQLYDSGLWTHDTATQHLAALGYDPGETDFILAVYDQRRELTMAQAAINQVRKVFLAKRIDASAASAMLGSLGVDATAQADYLAIWTVEQESELRELSMAQVGGILKKGGIDDAGAVARWVAMGYSPEDAALLLFDYGGPPPAGSPAANAPAGNTPTTGA